ncbi:MAG: mannose-1-phosphate guanylyltransferase/mannose-6-phosphate isomerase [Pseudomonadota bacterium]
MDRYLIGEEKMELVPVILAGGTGSRLWPVSRELRPKQFLRLTGELSLLQQTLKRAAECTSAAPVILCNHEHRFIVAEQCREIGIAPSAVVLEPAPRNTAPAIALAARLVAQQKGQDARLLVLPSDHLIQRDDDFVAAVKTALRAEADQLVTFGIKPNRPETGYGYIESVAGGAASGLQKVAEFVEKPVLEKAQAYVDSGRFYWNSGMFLLPIEALLADFQKHAPEVLKAIDAAMTEVETDLDFLRPGPAFTASPSISIDFAVMGQTAQASVLPIDVGWSDIGSWQALREVSSQDAAGNAVEGDVLTVDTSNSYLRSESRLLATLGIDGLVVIETSDAVLVAAEDRVQDIKQLVSGLKEAGRSEHLLHRRVFRPWGSYETVGDGDRYQVKRITVNPGSSISLQLHHHRAEHWVVVRGTAEVTRGEEKALVSENESTYIPIGTIHRLSNPGKLPLELIEVQVGAYLGEDDIVRLQDDYGRHT